MTGPSIGYSALSGRYDDLNGADYPALFSFIKDKLDGCGIKKGEILLDLGCGTGELTCALAKEGYDMIGVDSSPGMLSAAREKDGGDKVLFLCQEAAEFELYGTVRGILCTYDVLNHITVKSELEKVFSLCANYLEDGCPLIFDVLGEKRFIKSALSPSVTETDGEFCVVRTEYSEKSGEAEHIITLFSGDGDYYVREDSVVKERYYAREYLEEALRKAGFEEIKIYPPFSGNEEEGERYCFLCVRGKRDA